jgi:hypothetical protein
MHRYVVAGTQKSGQSITLCDSDGRFHIARASAGAPQFGTKLIGNRPTLGFGLLLGELLDDVYRVTFEAVHCGREEVLRTLQRQPSH